MTSWCCKWFSDSLKRDKEKGISVFASKEVGADVFFLQACPFDKEVVEEFMKINPETGFFSIPKIETSSGKIVPLNIGMCLAMKYCIQCGAKLDGFIKKNQKEFDRLAQEHLELAERYSNREKDNGSNMPLL
jgi:hypothetical protein